ncbi:MAG: glycosyltransferase [Planctomycetes bacterium]|nr:glycosyltransferase [Planctomycetota bacterium]MCG2684977.1 glycosyltransferase [Planctomycetales bacterium]
MEPRRYTLENRLEYAQKRIKALESELLSLRSQMDWITSRKAWLLVRFVHQTGRRWRHFLFDVCLRRGKKCAAAALRSVGLYPLAAWAWRQGRRIKRGLTRRIAALGKSPAAESQCDLRPDAEPTGGYDVICLPVILWNSRFQRPQQMARQQAAAGHRVFYASFGFHDDRTARLATLEPNVYEMSLPGTPGTNVYRQLPSDDDVRRMVSAIDQLRCKWRITFAVVVVQLPFWTALAEKLREKFGWPIVYDCMDDHSGFSTNCESMLGVEERTIAEADLVVVTSDVLEAKVRPKARRTALIRNACDYEHFSRVGNPGLAAAGTTDRLAAAGTAANSGPGADVPSAAKHITIGFYGAIAEWFDADLVADLAELRPRWRFELIGSTFTGDVARLEKLPNVKLLGEKPYADLPRFVAEWDAFIIPFKRIPLTEATNPVKAYEMLATGKPVAAVDLPELRPMARDGLLSLADDARGFAEALERELAEDCDRRRQQRRKFAARNTWKDRCEALDREIRRLFPPASIIIVTYNNLHLNQGCLESVFRDTDWPNFEVIVVDNASSDDTAEWLADLARSCEEKGDSPHLCAGTSSFPRSAWERTVGTLCVPGATPEHHASSDRTDAERPGNVFPRGAWEQAKGNDTVPFFRHPNLRVILNKENLGFAAANNQGLRAARGEFLCLLNNDTVVTRGWLSTMIGHLRAMPEAGMIGPVSNMVGNEAKVPVGYSTIGEMPRWAADYCRRHDGETFQMKMLGFFCVMFRREVYEKIGELDERFGVGYFEDTDYCYRARREGFELRCARDAFVHHWQGASFRLLGDGAFACIYRENQQLFESKWGAESMAGTY